MRRVLYILGQLTDEDTLWLAENGEKATYSANTSLIKVGQPTPLLFIILNGAASVVSPSGKTLAKVQSGDILGEMSFIDSAPPSASVLTESECTVLQIEKLTVENKLSSDLGFSARFYKALAMFLADRMRNTILSMGFGDDEINEGIEEDELDEELLDTVHLAGIRFEKILKTLNN